MTFLFPDLKVVAAAAAVVAVVVAAAVAGDVGFVAVIPDSVAAHS